MKNLLFVIIAIITIAGCSKQQVTETKIDPPIYVSFDTEGKMLFGPICQEASVSDGRHVIAGTDHTISVYCSELKQGHAVLTFIEIAPQGAIIRETTQEVPLGVGFTFKIFDSVDVTVRNTL